MDAGRERINTLKTQKNFDDANDVGDTWVFPIGWNRNLDPETGLPSAEPRDPRFLTNAVSTAKYTCLNFVPFNLLH